MEWLFVFMHGRILMLKCSYPPKQFKSIAIHCEIPVSFIKTNKKLKKKKYPKIYTESYNPNNKDEGKLYSIQTLPHSYRNQSILITGKI